MSSHDDRMIELLRALVVRWRGLMKINTEFGHGYTRAIEYCADELSAILRDHSGEARKAEGDETVADWCFTADVCAVPHWIIYPGLGNYEGMFARVSDCDTAKAICDAHNAVVAEMRGQFDELQRCFDMALEEWDIEFANRTKLEEAARSNPTPTAASGSRSPEPDAAMWREAIRRTVDELCDAPCVSDDLELDKIEQRARELAGKVA